MHHQPDPGARPGAGAPGRDAAHPVRRAAPRPSAAADRVSYPQLRVAGCYAPVAFRAFWKINGMVCPPEEVYADSQVVACTRDALSRYGSGPPPAQPTREQLTAALSR